MLFHLVEVGVDKITGDVGVQRPAFFVLFHSLLDPLYPIHFIIESNEYIKINLTTDFDKFLQGLKHVRLDSEVAPQSWEKSEQENRNWEIGPDGIAHAEEEVDVFQ